MRVREGISIYGTPTTSKMFEKLAEWGSKHENMALPLLLLVYIGNPIIISTILGTLYNIEYPVNPYVHGGILTILLQTPIFLITTGALMGMNQDKVAKQHWITRLITILTLGLTTTIYFKNEANPIIIGFLPGALLALAYLLIMNWLLAKATQGMYKNLPLVRLALYIIIMTAFQIPIINTMSEVIGYIIYILT